jgi:hypothetical protein
MTSSGWRLLGVLLLFGVGGLFGAAWFAADECAHTEGCGAYRAHYQKPANDSSKEVPHRETAEELVASYTGWLAVFTCGLFIVTSGLWGATWRLWKTTAKAVEDGEKSVKAAVAAATAAGQHVGEAARAANAMEAISASARDASERELRAYISLSIIITHVPASLNEPMQMRLDIRNFGKTPALQVKRVTIYMTHQHPFPQESELPPVPKSEEIETAGVVVFPNHAYGDVNRLIIPNLTDQQVERIFNGETHRAYIFTGCVYMDVFGKPHHTLLGYSLKGPELRKMAAGGEWDPFILDPVGRYNEATWRGPRRHDGYCPPPYSNLLPVRW